MLWSVAISGLHGKANPSLHISLLKAAQIETQFPIGGASGARGVPPPPTLLA